MRKALLHLNHMLIKSIIDHSMTVVDMTCGHGYDTEMLASYAKHVYAFDIQQKAIDSSKERLKHLNNITFIHDSFEHVFNYIDDAHVFVFNLGYLPKGDKTITTITENTLKTLHLITSKNPLAHLVVMSYVGHKEGKKEYDAIMEWSKTLSHHQIIVSRVLHHDDAPILVWVNPK